MKNLIVHIIFFHLILNINCQYAPKGRIMHTATLVGTKIYFLGGTTGRINNEVEENSRLNDFFYLDISKSFDKTKEILPFVDLSDKSLEITPHNGAATSVFGKSKDSIFLFGGNMGKSNDQSYIYSFNTSQSQWRSVTVSQGNIPLRKQLMGAITDNNDKIHLFGGGMDTSEGYIYSNKMDIFDTVNKIWTTGADGSFPRDGHTATFLPDTGEIIYIGGFTINVQLIDVTNLEVYNTIDGTWDKRETKNPPEPRYGHSAVLTNDMRIVIFGGATINIEIPVNNRYVVLNIKTWEWYLGKEDLSTGVPFRHHTATLYNDYMFIAFGHTKSQERPINNNVLIYKIGDFANFTEVNDFIYEELKPPISSKEPKGNNPESNNPSNSSNNSGVIIGIILGILLIIILGSIGFVVYKRYKKIYQSRKFSHVVGC